MNDAYDIEVPIGTGATATVFRARQRSLNRVVALKRVRVADATTIASLRDEAAVLATLDHPHIVRVLDVVADGDGVAVAMQYAAGGSLADRLRHDGPMSPTAVATMGAAIADALACAHRHGVVHRDVKPANILFDADGDALLSDFGVAHRGAGAPADVVGTVEYLDPAVIAGHPPDGRSDIYALGVVCREALGSAVDTAPAALRAALDRATATEPALRFGGAAELAVALRSVASGHESGTRTFGPRPPVVLPPRPPARRRRSPAMRPTIAAAALVAATAGAVVIAGRMAGRRPTGRDVASAVALLPPAPPPTSARPPSTLPTSARRPCAPPAPAGATALAGDVDRRGCAEQAVWADSVLTVGGRRWRLGRPGDIALLGDWDCDGKASPALYRPSTGQVFVFDGFAGTTPLTSRPAVDTGRRDGTPVVVAGATAAAACDGVEVRDPA